MMMEYLGICMVVVVVGLVIAVLAKLVTAHILDEFERIRQKRAARGLEVFLKALEGSAKFTTRFVELLKEADGLERTAKAEGRSESLKKNSEECFDKTLDELKKELDKK